MIKHASYRADIDGLRALAVLSVIIYHAFPNFLPGGFIGVDVFFVISGYLISGILFQTPIQNPTQLLNFYVRRVLRIYPALTIVFLSLLVLGWFTLLADELAMMGKHMAGGAAFVSNWVFWSESGYFDQASTFKPLLHLWSLGIEEQFYLFWPIALVVALHYRWSLRIFTLGLLLASLAWNLWIYQKSPVDAFYLPWARCWELLTGAWLAHAMANERHESSNKRQNIMASLGIGLLVLGCYLINENTAYPGTWALIPVLGSTFIIAAGPNSWVNRKLLSQKWLVGIGLISYPLYLWHWPLISWLHITEGQTPPASWLVAALGLSFALAYATWRWIEQPMRFGTHAKLKALILFSSVATLGITGWIIHLKDGLPHRSAAQVKMVYAGDHGHEVFFKWLDQNTIPCKPLHIYETAEVWESHVRCKQSRQGEVDVALIGDSHAEHLFPGLVQQYPELNIAYYFKIGPAFISNPKFEAIFEHIKQSTSIQHVIMTMFWERRLKAVPKDSTMSEQLTKTIEYLQTSGKTVSITNGTPHFDFDPNLCRLQRIKLTGQENRCQSEIVPSESIAEAFKSAKNLNIEIIDTFSFFCINNNKCSMVKNDQVIFRDDNHLNLQGSLSLGKSISSQLNYMIKLNSAE